MDLSNDTTEEHDKLRHDLLTKLLREKISVNIRFGHTLDPVDEVLSLELLEELQVSLKVLEVDRVHDRKRIKDLSVSGDELKQENERLLQRIDYLESCSKQNGTSVSNGATVEDTLSVQIENSNIGTPLISPVISNCGSLHSGQELELSLNEAQKEIKVLKERLRYASGSSTTSTPEGSLNKDPLSSPRQIAPPMRYRSIPSLHHINSGQGSEAEKKTQLIGKQFSSLLSKVASDVRVLESVKDIVAKPPIDTAERLQLIVNLLFDKALTESWDIARYVNLAGRLRHLSIYKANEDTGERELVRFQKLLLSRCHREFESDPYSDIDMPGKQYAVDSCEDPEKKMQLVADLNEEKRQAMRKKLGNIKFIGELYMSNMGDGALVVHCLRELASKLNDDTLELLCVLTRTVGRRLEKDYKVRGKFKDLEPFFKRLNQIVLDKNTSERVRFFIQDLLEMRANNWTDRHAVTFGLEGHSNSGSSGQSTPGSNRYSRSSRSSPMAPTKPLSSINSYSSLSLPWT
ncbi:Eukaryotic translation initiation factor 4 gamma 3 [Halotydeus destructor]|nr:Eukaryotic translation initiation factor 4 gamma 3 [Halotydeus destructor]